MPERTKRLAVLHDEDSADIPVLKTETAGENPQQRDEGADGRQTAEAILQAHFSGFGLFCFPSLRAGAKLRPRGDLQHRVVRLSFEA